MNALIEIVATGARTPVGLQAGAAAAAVRAGVKILGEHPYMTDQVGDLMPGLLDPELDPHILGAERLLKLAEPALREACAPLGVVSAPRVKLPVYLALPEIRPGFTAHDVETIRSAMRRFDLVTAEVSEVIVFPHGHAAGFAAFRMAANRLRQDPMELCLVGGVDTYFHPDTMEWLDENRQLMGAVSRSAFVPGEAAGFCLLMTEQACARQGFQALQHLRAVAVSTESKLIKTEDLCLGQGLNAALREAVSGLRLPEETINQVICDVNGERYRGEEWGFVCLQCAPYFDDPTSYVSPADCWGDIGAASGPLFSMLACQAAVRGYAKHRTCLWASSERGMRGVAILESINTS